MKQVKEIVYISFLTVGLSLCGDTDRRGLIIVPVADLVGSPIQSFGIAKTIKESYEKLALCGGANNSSDAFRIHQALFNDEVEILSLETSKNGEQEACIAYPSVFFIRSTSHKPNNIFWTDAKNIISFDELRRHNVPLENIPAPISFKRSQSQPKNQTIGLIKPFFDPITQKTFSVGTRFIIDPEKSTQKEYAAHILDPNTLQFKITHIPKDSAVLLRQKSPQEAIACFVALLKTWAHTAAGIIAYAWGGCSFTAIIPDHGFKEVPKQLASGQKIFVYERPGYVHNPCIGFDCTGLVLRAAQLCGIPYFFKNTYTLAHYLKSLAVDDHLHEGDLIWIPGHVMVVSDKAHNLLIEARGYSHDFGCVQEIALEKVFKGIKTYAQLVHAFHTHGQLIRLNKSGQDVETIKHFKLLKIASAWH
jgi:hypothetical protein